jgi:hypothetical protein
MTVDLPLRILNTALSALAGRLAAFQARWRSAPAPSRVLRVEGAHPDLRLLSELRACAPNGRRAR